MRLPVRGVLVKASLRLYHAPEPTESYLRPLAIDQAVGTTSCLERSRVSSLPRDLVAIARWKRSLTRGAHCGHLARLRRAALTPTMLTRSRWGSAVGMRVHRHTRAGSRSFAPSDLDCARDTRVWPEVVVSSAIRSLPNRKAFARRGVGSAGGRSAQLACSSPSERRYAGVASPSSKRPLGPHCFSLSSRRTQHWPWDQVTHHRETHPWTRVALRSR
jgi:hypothetical protein